jgi:hypothetical protein
MIVRLRVCLRNLPVRVATFASVIGVAVLQAWPAVATATAPPPAVRIFFDGRELFARPMLHVHAFGRTRRMLVDTGAFAHVMGPTAAGVSPGVLSQGEIISSDETGRPVVGIRMSAADLVLKGWPPLAGEVWVSSWVERNYRGKGRDLTDPHFDGVFAPITMAGSDRVVILDFAEGTMSTGTWKDADDRLAAAELALTPSRVSLDGGSMLIVPVVVDGRPVRVALDTGATSSVLFVPRGDDVPSNVTRTRTPERMMAVQAGEVQTRLRFSLIERLEPLALYQSSESAGGSRFDGLLGMDVLRSCILAFDRESLSARCLARASLARAPPAPANRTTRPMALAEPAPRASKRGSAVVQVGTDGVAVTPLADGGYGWIGHRVAAKIHRDGRLSFFEAPVGGRIAHLPLEREEERRWFDEQVSGLLVTLARAKEREVILEALAELPRRLSAILDDPRLSSAQRRQILFLLWDEMAEADDVERGWAGTRARQLIDAFVQRRLPRGSSEAYSDGEIAALNRLRGGATPFDPYAPPAGDRHRDRDP